MHACPHLLACSISPARPPILLVSVERDIGIITTWTGNIPGVAIMLVIPACLVIMAKKQFPEHEQGNTTHRSPFARIAYVETYIFRDVAAVWFLCVLCVRMCSLTYP